MQKNKQTLLMLEALLLKEADTYDDPSLSLKVTDDDGRVFWCQTIRDGKPMFSFEFYHWKFPRFGKKNDPTPYSIPRVQMGQDMWELVEWGREPGTNGMSDKEEEKIVGWSYLNAIPLLLKNKKPDLLVLDNDRITDFGVRERNRHPKMEGYVLVKNDMRSAQLMVRANEAQKYEGIGVYLMDEEDPQDDQDISHDFKK